MSSWKFRSHERTHFSQLFSGSTSSMHSEDGVVCGTSACQALGVIDHKSSCLHLRKDHNIFIRLLGQLRLTLFTLYLSFLCMTILSLKFTALTTTFFSWWRAPILNWIHHSVYKIYSPIYVLQAFLEEPVVHSDDETDVASLFHDYRDVFNKTVWLALSINPHLRSTWSLMPYQKLN